MNKLNLVIFGAFGRVRRAYGMYLVELFICKMHHCYVILVMSAVPCSVFFLVYSAN